MVFYWNTLSPRSLKNQWLACVWILYGNEMLTYPKYAVASWLLPNGGGVRRTMIMTAATGSLVGAVFPLTGFTGMPQAGPISQPVQQPGFQQPTQQTTQPQLSAASIPPELIPRLQMMRAMQARLGATGRNMPGSMLQPGATNTTQQHGQIPSGTNFEMMQALMQRKQDG